MKRQDYLKNICIEKYGEGNHPSPNLKELDDNRMTEIKSVYKELGGTLSEVPFNFRGYDIMLRDFIVELDEQEHFNRYRLKTLESFIYNDFHNFDVNEYKIFCNEYEHKCRKYGGFFKNDSTKLQFTNQCSYCNFEDLGASRWKQRAFYDFIKDIYSITAKIPIIRISIYERYNGDTINDLINKEGKKRLLEYVNLRFKQTQDI